MLNGGQFAVPDWDAILLIASKGHDGWRSRSTIFFMISKGLYEHGGKMRATKEDGEGIDFGPAPEPEDDFA